MPNVKIALSVSTGGDTKTGSNSATGDGGILDDIALGANASNTQVTFPFLIADLTAGALIFFADQAVTIKTNSSGSPDNTFHVPANGFVIVDALAANITALYCSNGNASVAATLSIRGVRDVTP